MQIQPSSQDGMTVLTLTGRLDLAAAPQLQRAVLMQPVERPLAIVCDLAQVEAIDPLCAGVFTSIRHPALGWPNPALVLCAPQPPVADILLRHGVARHVAIHPSLEEALANACARPPRLRERLLLGPVPTAARAGRGFVREVCGRWGLGGLAEPAALVASELITNGVAHAGTVLELRLELRRSRLQVAVADQDPNLWGVLAAKDGAQRGLGLLVVERVATAWGVRREGAGGKVVWCMLALPAGARLAASAALALAGRAAGPGWHRQLRQRPGDGRRCWLPRAGRPPSRDRWLGTANRWRPGCWPRCCSPCSASACSCRRSWLTQETEVCRRLEGAMDDLDTILHDLQAGLLNPQGPSGDRPLIGTGESSAGGPAG